MSCIDVGMTVHGIDVGICVHVAACCPLCVKYATCTLRNWKTDPS